MSSTLQRKKDKQKLSTSFIRSKPLLFLEQGPCGTAVWRNTEEQSHTAKSFSEFAKTFSDSLATYLLIEK